MKRIFYLVIIIIFVVLWLYSGSINLFSNNEACFDGDLCIGLELVTTEGARTKGLMFREELEENTGMLFVYEDMGIRKFWMKDTLIPLDIVWLDYNNKIVYLEENLILCEIEDCPKYGPDFPVKNVLEVNTGFLNRNGIKIGDVIEINL